MEYILKLKTILDQSTYNNWNYTKSDYVQNKIKLGTNDIDIYIGKFNDILLNNQWSKGKLPKNQKTFLNKWKHNIEKFTGCSQSSI